MDLDSSSDGVQQTENHNDDNNSNDNDEIDNSEQSSESQAEQVEVQPSCDYVQTFNILANAAVDTSAISSRFL